MSDELPEFFVSSRNMWEDLGEPDAEMKFARCQLMSRVMDLVLERQLTQKCAAEILGTNQPTVSDLMRGKMSKFSLERLIAFLNALGQDVRICVRARPEGSAGPTLVVVGEGIPS
ncbi:MAG TPA: helix-turn-helix transcriptional regulator [Longimicrobium sp.]|jgi:predicted XRE-type DNA-binding protein|nr:helix-turn-helix transcriptional regulator [Longimicrobium sp.]